MKKAMKLLLMYFMTLLASIIIGTIIYSIYLNVKNFVAGTSIDLFNIKDLVKAIFFVIFLTLFLILPFISYYKIRHSGGVPQTIVYVFLTILTWGILFPGSFYLERFHYSKFPDKPSEKSLSTNCFRSFEDKVYFFTKDFSYDNQEKSAMAVVIDTSEEGKIAIEKIEDKSDFVLYKQAVPYRDILIKNSFSKFSIPLLVDFGLLIQKGKDALNKGWTFYLGFCSIGLLLASVWALSGIFKWRLLNTCFVVVTSFLILTFNSFVIHGKFEFIINKIWNLPFIKPLNSIFENPVLVILNLLFALIFTVIGIIIFIVQNHKKKEGGN